MITDEEFEAATRRGEEERARVPAITGVSYRRRQRELVIHFAVGMKLTVPVAIVQGLESDRDHWRDQAARAVKALPAPETTKRRLVWLPFRRTG